MFDLHHIFPARNPGVKRDLPVHGSTTHKTVITVRTSSLSHDLPQLTVMDSCPSNRQCNNCESERLLLNEQ